MTHKASPPVHGPNAYLAEDATRRLALTRLLPLWPAEIDDVSLAGRERVVRLLAKALREERCRGQRGHWAYDLVRHATLARHHRAECEALANERRRLFKTSKAPA